MNLVVQRADVQVYPVRTPTHRRGRRPHLERRNGDFTSILAGVPYFHRLIVRGRSDQLGPHPSAGCEAPVHRVDNLAVGVDPADTLARGDVCEHESVVCRDGEEVRGAEGPLQVGDRGFGVALQEAVVGVGRIRPPEGCKPDNAE